MASQRDEIVDLPPLPRLLCAYAPPAARDWQRLCWQLDQRLAAVVRRGGDPTIAAIRLAWWDAVLVEDDRTKGGGEPLVEQWRATAPAGAASAAERLIEGWRLLVAPEAFSDADLRTYGDARGGGLFALLARAAGTDLDATVRGAGRLWALWDLAGHVRDPALAQRAITVARDAQAEAPAPLPGRALKPLRLARAVALPDVRAGRVPPAGFAPRHYGRLLLGALRG